MAASRRRRSVSALLQAKVAVFRESVFSGGSRVAGAAVFSADCSRLPPVVSSTGAGGWVASASRPRGWRRSVGGRLTVPAAIGSIIRSYGQSWQVGSRVPRLHRPNESSARAPLHPPLPPVRGRAAVERLAAPGLPDRGAALVPGARGRARPASPARRAGGRAAAAAGARLPARTSAHVVASDRGREGGRADRGGDRQGRAAAPAQPGRPRRAVPVLPPQAAGGARHLAGDVRVCPAPPPRWCGRSRRSRPSRKPGQRGSSVMRRP